MTTSATPNTPAHEHGGDHDVHRPATAAPTPETNAVATMMLPLTLLLLLVGQMILVWQARRNGRLSTAAMAGVIADA